VQYVIDKKVGGAKQFDNPSQSSLCCITVLTRS